MNSQNHIDSAIFDTTYARNTVTQSQQTELDIFIRDNLPRVIDEVFDDPVLSTVLDHNNFKLDKLEINLGNIPFREYRQKMPGILREKLTRELGRLGATAALPDIRDPEFDLVSALANSDIELIRTSWDALFKTDHQLLKRILYNHGQRQDIQNTIGSTFTATMFNQLIQLLMPADYKFVQGLIAHASGLLPSSSEVKIRSLNYLLTSGSSNLQKPAYFADFLTRLPGLEGLAESEWLNHLSHRYPYRFQTTADHLHFDLVSALANADTGLIRSSWNALFKTDQQRLKKILNFYGQQQDIQHNIVSSFTTKMFNQLIQLLVPNDYEFIQVLITNASRLSSRSSEVKLRSLNYLLADSAGDVDGKSCLAGFLRELSKLEQINEKEWLKHLGKSREVFAERFQVIASHLPREEAIPDQSNIERDLKPYQHIEHLQQALKDIRKASTPALIDDIEILTNEYPWLLIRFYRELKTDTHIQFDTLPSRILNALIESLLNLNPLSTSTRLYQAIQETAEKSINQPLFLARVLNDLIQGEILNLLAIEAEIKPHHNSPLKTRQQQPETMPPPVVESQKQAADSISSIFKLKRPITLSQQQSLIRAISYLSQKDRLALQFLVRNSLLNHDLRQITEHLSESALRAILSAINLPDAGEILQSIELLNTAALSLENCKPAEQLQKYKWQFIFQQSIKNQTSHRQLLLRYIHLMINLTSGRDTRAYLTLITQSLLKNSLPSTRSQCNRLISLLADTIESIPELPAKSALTVDDENVETPDIHENIFVENAGIVLATPYFPVLFSRLEYTDDRGFKSMELAGRALHCVQFLVNKSTSSPEYQLVLNKLLCGIRTGIPIPKSIELTSHEIDHLEGLLLEVTRQWKPLNNTSIDGLRESFLQRNGRLQRKGDAWHLRVESKPWDMLLDSIPWSYSLVKFRWMSQIIYVEWR